MKKILTVLLSLVLIISFASCGTDKPADRKDPEVPEISENPEASEPEKTEPEETEPEYTENGERKEVSATDFENAVEVILSEEITVGGKPAEESDCVKIGGEIIYYHETEKYPSGNPYGEGDENDMHTEAEAAEHTLVTITKPGEYFIKGELKGQLAVDLGEKAKTDPNAKVTLIFGGADIVCEIAPAVIFYNVYECESLSAEPSADVDTSAAGANVVAAKGSVSNIKGANVAKIFEDNDEEKKLHKYDAAFYSKMSMNMGGEGVLNIEAENEGVGSEMHLTISGGKINITSKDDGINTNEDGISVTTINGGKITVKGGLGIQGDGIDSNGWLVISGGELFASGNEKSADGGIDADNGIIINGGTVFAFGNKNDGISSESAQVFARLEFYSDKKAGSKIEFLDSEGKGIVAENDREFRSLVISSPEFKENVEYNLRVNGVLQEFSSNKDTFEQIRDGIKDVFDGFGKSGFDNGGSSGTKKEPEIKDPYKVPENLDKWMESEDDIPKEIREWIENMKDVSEKIGAFSKVTADIPENGEKNEADFENNENPGKTEYIGLDDKIEDPTIFVLTDEIRYFSGILDSVKETGKERVHFTVDGEKRIEDIFKGDIPEIRSIECTEKIPPEHIVVCLTYEGRSEDINISRGCLLSEGYSKVNELFKDLEVGSYCLSISVSEKSEDYSGLSEFNFQVVD